MLNSLWWGEDPVRRMRISAGPLHQQWGWQTSLWKSPLNSRCMVRPLELVASWQRQQMSLAFPRDSWMATSHLKVHQNSMIILFLFWSHIPILEISPNIIYFSFCCLDRLILWTTSYFQLLGEKPKEKSLYIFSLFHGRLFIHFNNIQQSRNRIQTKYHLNR